MRIFIAINFNDKIKARINQIQQLILTNAKKSRLTTLDNLHITVVFIGQVEENRTIDIIKCIDSIAQSEFTLRTTRLNYFKGDSGNLYYLGIEDNNTLNEIHEGISRHLQSNGYYIERRKFKPHITLSRRTIIDNNISYNIPMDILVSSIDLMQSKVIDGNLTYKCLYSKSLQ